MTLDTGKLLARKIAGIANEQDVVKQNLSGNDDNSLIQVGFSEYMVATGTFKATAYWFKSGSFVIDHPIYSLLDSTLYKLDQGYMTAGGGTISIPITMPISFGATLVSSVLYTTTF